ncbi:hypothetical protein [Bdellovibrio sp. HCB288]|uniref:hypothetical protein n=1 Tax=Bdellovibrio sp. HCB288 TaxID=3394355 RepID=UPI0039B64F73
MKKLVYFVLFIVLAATAGIAANGGYQSKATTTFTDGSMVELIEITSPRGVTSQLVQIKDASGAVCYSVANVSNSAPGFSCVK